MSPRTGTRILPVAITFFMMFVSTQVDSQEAETYQWIGLKLHNDHRCSHQVGKLMLDDKLNQKAVQCAFYYLQLGSLDHSCPHSHDLGESLLRSTKNKHFNSHASLVKLAVETWYSEHASYPFDDTSIRFQEKFGHFIQMVWKGSKKLGVGVVSDMEETTFVVVTLYHPKMIGNLKNNVFKAVEDQDCSDSDDPPDQRSSLFKGAGRSLGSDDPEPDPDPDEHSSFSFKGAGRSLGMDMDMDSSEDDDGEKDQHGEDGKGKHKDGKGKHKVGKGKHKDGKGKHKDGKGNHKDGKGNHKDGKGNHKDGNDNHKNRNDNHNDGNGNHKDGKGKHGGAGDHGISSYYFPFKIL